MHVSKPAVPPKPSYLKRSQRPVALPAKTNVESTYFTPDSTISSPFQSSTNHEPQFFYDPRAFRSYQLDSEASRNLSKSPVVHNNHAASKTKQVPPWIIQKRSQATTTDNSAVVVESESASQKHGDKHVIDNYAANAQLQDTCLSSVVVEPLDSPVEHQPGVDAMKAPLVDVVGASSNQESAVWNPAMSTDGVNHLDRNDSSSSSAMCVVHSSKAYNVAREIVATELDYLECLKLVLVDMPAFVQGTIPPEDLQAWCIGFAVLRGFSEEFHKDLSLHLESYAVDQRIAPVFLKKGQFLMVYVDFIANFERLIDTYRALLKKYPSFADRVTQFEASSACKKLPLVEYLHKPVQRLPRYPLLMGTYLRALPDDHPDRDDAKRALDLVSGMTSKANTSLAQLEKVSRLLWYQARTLGYTFLRANRTYIREGMLKKLSRKSLQDRIVLLCSDALICGEFDSLTSIKFTVKVEYPLSDIMVEKVDPDVFYPDVEFQIRSPEKSCVFQAASMEERNAWMSAIQRAIDERPPKQLVGPQEVPATPTFAPIWIPDYRVRACTLCKKQFGFLRRYHHCRKCGAAICSSCSPHEVGIDYKKNRLKRVCTSCFNDASERVH